MADSAQRLALSVATPTGIKVQAQVESFQAPGIEGEFGVLPGHLPLLSALKPGVIRYQEQGKVRLAAVDKGYIEAGPDRVRLLAEGFADPGQVDQAATQDELKEAEEALKNFEGLCEGSEYSERLRAVDWARAKLAILAN